MKLKLEDLNLTEEEKEMLIEHKKKKKKWIIAGVIIAVILVMAVIIYLFVTSEGAEGQIDEFDNAVKKNDYKKLSEIIDSGETHITSEDAKHFVTYIKKPENKKRFNQEIENIKKKLNSKNSEDSDLGKITDKNGKTIIDITRNGSRMFFLDDLAFSPNFYTVYVNEGQNTASYEFKYNGKSQKKVGIANQKNELGRFFVGDYDIPTTKIFKDSLVDGSVEGKLHINTDRVDKDGKIFADDTFPQAYFKVDISDESLFKDNLFLNIDGKEIEYDPKKVYGKYPADAPIDVSATGKVNNHTLETDSVDVEDNKTNKPQEIKLSFDSEEIKREKEENERIEKEAKKFMEDYVKKLNTGYKVYDFSALKYCFEDDKSDVAENIKKQVEGKKKHKYSKPEFKSYERDGNEIKIVLSKKDEHHKEITSEYILTYNQDKNDFKIKDYKDI